MKFLLIPAISAASLAAASRSGAAVVITEVLYNEVGGDVNGEWIEIHNNGATAVDLSDWKIGDEETSGATSTTEAMFVFPAGSTIAAGEALVIAVDAGRFFTVYGFLPDFELAGSPTNNAAVPDLSVYAAWDPDGTFINMNNSNDQALVLDAADTIVDAVGWGNTSAFNPGLDPDAELDGQSYYRIDPAGDTDSAADWAVTPGGAGAATPGMAVPEPSTLLVAGLAGFAIRRRRA
jgi:Lamin Tail Domain/PEP-CTERM motif